VTVKPENVLVSASESLLHEAVLSIKTDKRPTKCFLCLGNPNLIIRERAVSYITPGSLSRHFLGKHVKKLEKGNYIKYRICNISLKDRVALLIHGEGFHGTVSRGPAERLLMYV
jgi:hypothetical protein